MKRAHAATLLAAAIAVGLASRKLPPIGLSVWDETAGDVLYAVAVFALLALISPRSSPVRLGVVAFAVCLGVEVFQLTGIPRRAPPVLRFVLGTTFAWHDVGAYAVGAATSAAVAESGRFRQSWLMRGLSIMAGGIFALGVAAASCSSSDDGGSANGDGGPSPSPTAAPTGPVTPEPEPTFDNGGRVCTGVTRSTAPDDAEDITPPPEIVAAPGLRLEAIARVPAARHIAPLANGDLLVGTNGESVYLVPHADADKVGTPTVFTTIEGDAPVHGVTFHEPSCNVFVAGQTQIHRIPYSDAMDEADPGEPIARVRPEGKGGHITTSVVVAGAYLYASVGSTCNACTETDPTRATIQRMNIDGSGMTTYARRIRNAIGLTVNPETRVLWAGVAGQDGLPLGHPYEFFDAVTTHAPVVDYGWPDCEENQKAYAGGADCSNVAVPRVVLPAYSTLTGAAFYPKSQGGANAFPDAFKGGAFVVARGAWHQVDDKFYSPPRVVFVRMDGDTPAVPVDWDDPSKQWTEVVTGFESADKTTRHGRPTGIAVGRDGTVYFADDQNGLVFRLRPAR